jgi:hypothetical protein
MSLSDFLRTFLGHSGAPLSCQRGSRGKMPMLALDDRDGPAAALMTLNILQNFGIM